MAIPEPSVTCMAECRLSRHVAIKRSRSLRAVAAEIAKRARFSCKALPSGCCIGKPLSRFLLIFVPVLGDWAYLAPVLGLSTLALFIAPFYGWISGYSTFATVIIGFLYLQYRQEQHNPRCQAYWRKKRQKEVHQ